MVSNDNSEATASDDNGDHNVDGKRRWSNTIQVTQVRERGLQSSEGRRRRGLIWNPNMMSFLQNREATRYKCKRWACSTRQSSARGRRGLIWTLIWWVLFKNALHTSRFGFKNFSLQTHQIICKLPSLNEYTDSTSDFAWKTSLFASWLRSYEWVCKLVWVNELTREFDNHTYKLHEL